MFKQVPVSFFEMMAHMSDAELRVTLVLIEKTFGCHQQSATVSISELMRLTGLSYNGVAKGCREAEARGTFQRVNPNAKARAQWRLCMRDAGQDDTKPSASEGVTAQDPQQVRVKPSASEGVTAQDPQQVRVKPSASEGVTAQDPQQMRVKPSASEGVTAQDPQQMRVKPSASEGVTAQDPQQVRVKPSASEGVTAQYINQGGVKNNNDIYMTGGGKSKIWQALDEHGIIVTGLINAKRVEEWPKLLPEEDVIRAIKEAASRGARNVPYIDKIVKTWHEGSRNGKNNRWSGQASRGTSTKQKLLSSEEIAAAANAWRACKNEETARIPF